MQRIRIVRFSACYEFFLNFALHVVPSSSVLNLSGTDPDIAQVRVSLIVKGYLHAAGDRQQSLMGPAARGRRDANLRGGVALDPHDQ